MANPVRRLSDAARDVWLTLDEFGSAWEGATTRNIRSEKIGRTMEVAPPPPKSATNWTLLALVGGVALLLAWS